MTPPKPQEAPRKRGRTGCITCRIRKVKCDEARPVCKRCSSTGRKCDGYLVPAPATAVRTSKTERRSIAPKPAARQNSPGHHSLMEPSPSLQLAREEMEGFQFFVKHTAPAISGFFTTVLWDKLVPQLAHREPSILHAMIAAGSMHLARRKQLDCPASKVPSSETLPLVQYLKSLRSLRMRIENGEDRILADIVLIVCLIFLCLEMLQGNGRGVVTHLETGLRILLQTSRTRSNLACSETGISKKQSDELISVFSRLDIDSILFVERSLDGSTAVPTLTSSLEESLRTSAGMLCPFPSLNEARHCLDAITSVAYTFSANILRLASEYPNTQTDFAFRRCYDSGLAKTMELSGELSSQMNETQFQLSTWYKLFQNMGSGKVSEGSGAERQARSTLKLRYYSVFLGFLALRNRHEALWDEYIPSFKEIVVHAEALLALPSPNSSVTPVFLDFALESACIPALYLVALKCRERNVRWKAISLLGSQARQEGMWNSKLITLFVDKLARTEEEKARSGEGGLVTSIPEQARYSDVILAGADEPGFGRIVCGRFQYEEGGEYIVEQSKFRLDMGQWSLGTTMTITALEGDGVRHAVFVP